MNYWLAPWQADSSFEFLSILGISEFVTCLASWARLTLQYLLFL